MVLAARLDRALRAAGVPLDGVSIGSESDRSTWRVSPASAQAAAQPVIDAFDPDDDAAHATTEMDAAIKQAVDIDGRLSAVVWAIIDQVAPPATPAKYQAARTKIIAAYKARPWEA